MKSVFRPHPLGPKSNQAEIRETPRGGETSTNGAAPFPKSGNRACQRCLTRRGEPQRSLLTWKSAELSPGSLILWGVRVASTRPHTLPAAGRRLKLRFFVFVADREKADWRGEGFLLGNRYEHIGRLFEISAARSDGHNVIT